MPPIASRLMISYLSSSSPLVSRPNCALLVRAPKRGNVGLFYGRGRAQLAARGEDGHEQCGGLGVGGYVAHVVVAVGQQRLDELVPPASGRGDEDRPGGGPA